MRHRGMAVLAVGLLAATVGCSGDDQSPTARPDRSDATDRTAGASATSRPADPADAFTPEPLDWQRCGSLQCATLEVPLDYDRPEGERITLALNRRPAEDADQRLGSLLVNPGGPGGSGLELSEGLSGPMLPDELAEAYDLVGFDPRGVGESSPVTCGQEEIDAYRRVDSSPDAAAEQASLDDAAASVGATCEAVDGVRLPFMGTDSVVRDMEVMRRALGDRELNFLGFSYGTFLALRYLKLFPERAGAMALDGVVDPTMDLPTLLEGQAVAFEAALLRNLADPEDLALYDRVAARVEAEPLPADEGTVGPTELAVGAGQVAYVNGGGPRLVDALEAADRGDGSEIEDLAESYTEGLQFPLYLDVACMDSPHPTGRVAWAAFADRLIEIAPRVGASIANEMAPCAEWPVPVRAVNEPVDGAGGPPVLLVGATGDPATPYEQAVRVADGLVDGHLLTFEGDGHGAWFASSCVRDAVGAFLVDGTVPDPGATCEE